eukprot:365303-Chlamydomonas_euryale.AAC.65
MCDALFDRTACVRDLLMDARMAQLGGKRARRHRARQLRAPACGRQWATWMRCGAAAARASGIVLGCKLARGDVAHGRRPAGPHARRKAGAGPCVGGPGLGC